MVVRRIADGDNHKITVEDDVVCSEVWMRPDLDHETGARNAAEIVEHVERLIGSGARGWLNDVRRGPIVCGPKTQGVLGRLMALCERKRARCGVLTSSNVLQQMQYQRLVDEFCPTMGRVYTHEAQIRSWLMLEVRD